ncbi:hypothetical protein RCL1_008799 [Eukaryota sp. TZLM3-RCL]
MLQNRGDVFLLDNYVDATESELLALVQSCYGKSLSLSQENSLPLFLLSKSLAFDGLLTASQAVLKSFSETSFEIPLSTIMSRLKNDHLTDFELVFHDQSITLTLTLTLTLKHKGTQTKFSRNWQESEENCSNFTELFKVSPSSFADFFTSFYDEKLEVTLENAFDYSHLAWYFKLSELEKFVNNFIENSESEYNWVTSLVSKAIMSDDYRFIKIISTKISTVPNLSNCDPIAVHPLFFQNLTSNINVSWLLKCLVFSYSNFSQDNDWTPQTLETSIAKINLDVLTIDEMYQTIEPLFSISELFDFLSSFSLSVFSKFTSRVPLNWFTWFIVESDLRKEFNLISQVSPLLNEVITPENISQVPISSFNSETLLLFAINSKKEHLVVWLINCLIELWSNSHLNTNDFSRILMCFDLSETSTKSVYSCLTTLFADEILQPILFQFISQNLVPMVFQEFAQQEQELLETQSKLAICKQEQTEQEKKITTLEASVERLQSLLEEKDKLLAQQTIKLNKVEFSQSFKGSYIMLSDNNRVATKIAKHCHDNSTVVVNHQGEGTVVFTLNSTGGGDFWTWIGFFDPNHIQDASCYSNSIGLRIERDSVQCYLLNCTHQDSSAAISISQQIVVVFNNSEATFSVPSTGYSKSVSLPSNYVLGLSMHYTNTSWVISDS